MGDAQCFGIQGSIEPGSFTLVGAAVLLAFLNSFVTKATKQYRYYLDRSDCVPYDDNDDVRKEEDDDDAEKNFAPPEGGRDGDGDGVDVLSSLRPVPVMFTDTYRWLLRGG